MNNTPVSTIIPVYNGELYIAEAIASVLSQTAQPSQVLVIDDGSTDGTAGIVAQFKPRVDYIHQPQQGSAAARNLGVTHATGDLLAFLDADDVWMPDKLARQMPVLLTDLACEAVLGRVENFISPELDDAQRQPLARAAMQSGGVHVGALLIHRQAFFRVGWFDTRWRQSEFVEWWSRALRSKLAYITLPDLVLRRRLHTNNLTRRERNGSQEYLSMLREQIVWRRKAAPQTHNANPERT